MTGYYILIIHKTDGSWSYMELRATAAEAERERFRQLRRPEVKKVELAQQLNIFI